jgi:protein-S-isoprenylcysteine O-methyltransferase Ste14
MTLPVFVIYPAHGLYWTAFGAANLISKRDSGAAAGEVPAVAAPVTASHSKLLVTLHAVAFGVMYFGIGAAVFTHRVPAWFPGQELAGLAVILLGAMLVCRTRLYFRSWRFQAKLDTGHQLATGGPFRWVRHPIYAGLDLLALGSALWIPSVTMWVAFVLMAIGSDLRGRAEERLLALGFGERYRDYCRRTSRFVPGVY